MDMDLDVIFAYVVGVLAALTVVGALVFALVWEFCAIKRTLTAYRRSLSPQESTEMFWHGSAVTVPTQQNPRKW
jgi:hypothetical protein